MSQRPFTEQLAFKPQSKDEPNVFETIHPPQKMGNPANIAYGGYALATACKAAYLSVPPNYHLYSMLGNYLGPTLADRPVRASVRTIRQTRVFATRQIEISQKQDDGQSRVCMIAMFDFQVREKKNLLTYSRQPSKKYSHWKDLPPQEDVLLKLVKNGKVTEKMVEEGKKMFSLIPPIFEQRLCPEGIFSQNLSGMAKTLPTTQDHLPITDRTTADWIRCKQELPNVSDHMNLLTFLIDGAISFAPLGFSKNWFEDVSACSSLDFALRIFQNGREEGVEGGLDLNKWHFRELSTSVGEAGRTYGGSWIWDESGKAVACMTQQSIARPAAPRKGKL